MAPRTYQLPPIPADRGFALSASPSCSSSMADSSPLASNSRAAQLVVDVDEPMASPTKPSSSSATTTGSAGSSHTDSTVNAERKRPSALLKLRLGIAGSLGGYPRDPDGTSAVVPPSPLVSQQLSLAEPASPGPAAPTFTGADGKRASVPSRFQPKKVMQAKGFPSVLSGKGDASSSSSSSRPGKLQKQQQRLSRQGFPFPEMHLTPPPTPHKGGVPQTIVTEPMHIPGASHLPPTPPPICSPLSPSIPQTVSAQALWHHAVHPLFLAQYELGDELGSGGFGFVVQARRLSDGMICAVKFIYKEKVPERAWVKDEHWGDADDAKGVLRTSDGIKRIPLEAVRPLSRHVSQEADERGQYVLKTIRHRGVVAFVDLFEDKKYIYLVSPSSGLTEPASDGRPRSWNITARPGRRRPSRAARPAACRRSPASPPPSLHPRRSARRAAGARCRSAARARPCSARAR